MEGCSNGGGGPKPDDCCSPIELAMKSGSGRFMSRFQAKDTDDDASPTPTNANALENPSPILTIKTPVANFNPFYRRPCVGGTQSLKRQEADQLITSSPSLHPTEIGNASSKNESSMSTSGFGTMSELSSSNLTDTSLQEILSSLQESKDHNNNCSGKKFSDQNSKLNSILRETNAPSYDGQSNLLDENLASMSKYVEELTGFTANSQKLEYQHSHGKAKLPSNICCTKELMSRLFNGAGIPQNSNNDLMSPSSMSSSSSRRQVFNFNGRNQMPHQQSPLSGQKRLINGSLELGNSDAAILNVLSSLPPQTVTALLRNYESINQTTSNVAPTSSTNSLLQTLEWLNNLQMNGSKSDQATSSHQINLNTYLAAAAALTANESSSISGNQQSHQNAFQQLLKNLDILGAASSAVNPNAPNQTNDIEFAANNYRNSAISVAQRSEAAYHWSGKLPSRNYNSMTFSRKVFLGGVPWDATSDDIVQAFCSFGPLSVIWPQRENQHGHFGGGSRMGGGPKGYCYLIFDHEQSVSQLLTSCYRDPTNGGDYYRVMSPKMVTKDVQVIPWVVSDSQYRKPGTQRLENTRTVFIGALHGMITAEALATIMNDLFGNVVFAAIDTDKYKYPIGSGRVTFSNQKSYVRAVTANFVEVRTAKFSKTIQIDPYLEDSTCSKCHLLPGLYFCRSFECFSYFCPNCWSRWHNSLETIYNHKPLRRSSRQQNEHISC